MGSEEEEPAVKTALAGNGRILHLGALPFGEILSLYRSEGALVLPSYSENWGLVVNEAMH